MPNHWAIAVPSDLNIYFVGIEFGQLSELVQKREAAGMTAITTARLVSALNRNGALTSMPEDSLAAVVAAGKVVGLAEGQAIQHQGHQPDGVFCVLNGQMRFSAADAEGGEFLYYVGYSGVWFGHGCIDGSPAIVTATAMLPSEVFCIAAQNIRSLLASDPHVTQCILRTVTWLTRIAFGRVRENSTLPSAQLVPHLLYQQYHQAVEAGLGKEASRLRLSQVDVSNMCGLSPKSVSRALQALKGRGVVALSYNAITILDHEQLRRDAGNLG